MSLNPAELKVCADFSPCLYATTSSSETEKHHLISGGFDKVFLIAWVECFIFYF